MIFGDSDALEAWVEIVDLLLGNIALLILAYFFFLKGLNFRRITLLGRMLCIEAITLGFLFLAAWIGMWLKWEGVWWIRMTIRAYLIMITFRSLVSMSWTYGGWKAMHRRAWRNLKEMVRLRRIPIEYGPGDRVE